MAARRRRYIPSAIGQGIRCAVGEKTASGLIWQQVCVEGKFLGHPKFPEVDWTPEIFDTIIANLHKHPGFRAGPDGVGIARVIPWDYEHANEIAKMNGTIPAEGLPSCSWGYDLRKGTDDAGKVTLEELVEWLPTAQQQVANGEYQCCSVCVAPHYIDPISGQDQGPTMTSTALTNDPFVQGMAHLIAATLEQYGPAESALEVLVGIRSALELSEDATAQQAIEQLRLLFDAIANDTVPEYVEADYILDRIRRLLKLPLLATPEQILGGAELALNQLPTGGAGEPALTPTVPTENTPMAASLLTSLAVILACQETEPAILQAAKQAQQKAETADANATAAGALEQLKALFGSNDMDDLLAKATKTIADAKALEPAVATLTEMRNALKANAEADATSEAEAVAASMAGGDAGLLSRFRPVILAARMSCINPVPVGAGAYKAVDEAKLAKFREDYPLPEEQKALLTRRVVAGPDGVQLGGPVTGYQTQPITQSAGGAGKPNHSDEVNKIVEALNASPGRNPYEKANHLLCSRIPAHKSLDYAEQCRVAGAFTRELMAGKVPAGFKL